MAIFSWPKFILHCKNSESLAIAITIPINCNFLCQPTTATGHLLVVPTDGILY